MLFFTADNHFCHKNIIKYCNRPFNSIKEMNGVMIERWNSKVASDDTVIVAGDFCLCNRERFKEIHDSLNGRKIYLKGSHGDKTTKAFLKLVELEYIGYQFSVTHNPDDINCTHRLNLSAHVHDKWEVKTINDSIVVNIGVDVWNFYPITIEEVAKRYKNWVL